MEPGRHEVKGTWEQRASASMLLAVTGTNLKYQKGDRGNKHLSKVCEGHRTSVHSSVTLRMLHGFRGLSKLYGVTPSGIICYGCGSG